MGFGQARDMGRRYRLRRDDAETMNTFEHGLDSWVRNVPPLSLVGCCEERFLE